jgi:hypothetical protein
MKNHTHHFDELTAKIHVISEILATQERSQVAEISTSGDDQFLPGLKTNPSLTLTQQLRDLLTCEAI